MPTGAGVGAGPFHSQSNEAWFFHTPGLKIVYPSNPYDAKGLLAASIEDPNPVLFFEHKLLYRSLTGPVPEEYYTLPFGQAAISSEGSDLTIVTYGLGVHWAHECNEEFGAGRVEVIDLRTLIPWDKETIRKSVEKTGRLLILHEDSLTGGIGAEISAWASEELFTLLDAPVVRCASLDTPVPFSTNLEAEFLANNGLKEKIAHILEF
jgi:2-oxoisovalerate dehydrogenase E1 component